jgi:hypothetical protein
LVCNPIRTNVMHALMALGNFEQSSPGSNQMFKCNTGLPVHPSSLQMKCEL